MASQRIMIAKIVGNTAMAVLNNLLKKQDDARFDEYVDGLLRFLNDGSIAPLVYFSDHLDAWSSGSMFQHLIDEDNEKFYDFSTQEKFVYVHILPDRDFLKMKVNEMLADEAQYYETSWFYNRVKEAIDTYDMNALEVSERSYKAMIIIVRYNISGTITNDLVKDAFNKEFDLFKKPSPSDN